MVTGAITPQPSTMSTVNTQQNSAPAEPVKRSSDNRRSNKPIMEKRRRARINNCLNELKTLILDAMKKDPARHSKLEKADILEMTVKHLENLQRQQNAMSQATDPNVLNKFKAGFTECANEVGRFPELEPMVKRRLLQHLSNCINGVKTELPQKQRTSTVQVHILPSPPSSPDQHQPEVHHQTQVSQITATTNGYFVTNGVGTGVQLIPTKLANGSIAFVLPQQISAAATPVPMLVPIPTRTSSTGSAASSHSSSAYERVPQEHSPYHSPPSPANSNYEPMDCQTTPHQEHYYQHHQQQQQHQYNHHPQQQQRSYSPSSAPLSLVVRKSHEHEIKEDERPWRPW